MTTKIVDCRGLNCPQPVINTKKALEEKESDVIITIVDNDVSRQNVSLFARNNGYAIQEEQKDGAYHLTINRRHSTPAPPTPEQEKNYPRAEEEKSAQGPVYFITTNNLGQGSPDLGQVLMKSLFVTLAASTPRPAALLFLNTGVFLTCQGSPVLEQLEQLYHDGTAVLACGTCLDYYKLGDKLVWGTISNMFDINNWLYKSHRVITIA